MSTQKTRARFLIGLQSIFRTDISYITKNGGWITLSYMIQIGAGIIVTVTLANTLSKEALGAYQFILAMAGLLSALTLTGFGAAVTRAVALGSDGILRSAAQTKLLWSLGIVAGCGITSLYYFYQDNYLFATAFLIVGTFAPFIESAKLYENYLHGKEAFRDSVLLGIWRKPLPLITILVTLLFTQDILILIFAYYFSNFVSYIWVYFLVIKKYKLPSKSDNTTLQLSKHLSVLRILQQAGAQIDKILLWHFLGSVAVAQFAIAQIATKYSGGLINSMAALVLPKLSKQDLNTLKVSLPRKVALFSLVMGFGVVLYILAAPFLFTLLFPAYESSILISQVLALGLLCLPRNVFVQAFIAHTKTKSQYIVGISSPILKVFLLIALIPVYDIWGAVYAILIADSISYVLSYVLFKTA